ncbi:hypothetical protein RPR_05755 [Rickettsia peacockii str. Rustic]|uniref:Acetyltransferase n=1 Tax=Rickettsia peacockii (strain Rustic) TaxID=562019 RepID=C4K2B4_RICPU|nr:acetyltransferase [Rickettsia peacockii]ACR47711.1 hypothetical protein RPR_05755 [Rickettsia peacockii str. Rustic]
MPNHNNPYPHLFPKQAKETIFLKHFIHNLNIIVGDYTYYNDANHPEKFEYENVRGAHFAKLIIGKFCAIAMGTSIVLLSVILQRYRFPDEIVEQLLEIQWWDWDYDKITRNIPAIVGADIEKLKQAE